MLENDSPKTLRKEISGNALEFEKIVGEESCQHYFGGLSKEGKIKRIPSGFEKDDPVGEYLKLKNFSFVVGFLEYFPLFPVIFPVSHRQEMQPEETYQE
ncbi:hypothetical protein QFZ48_005018 [Chitinophaga sp. W2I13]|uniref:DUF2461 family protein n=1 Tax=Chitinophaga sp. W2I13 TaxID=3373923 RepID=UPI003D232C44